MQEAGMLVLVLVLVVPLVAVPVLLGVLALVRRHRGTKAS
jgi:hypothetical protein